MIDARDVPIEAGSAELIQRGKERLAEYGIDESFEIENLPGPRTRYIKNYGPASQRFTQHPATWLSRSMENENVAETLEGHLTLTALEGYDILNPYKITDVEISQKARARWSMPHGLVTDVEREETENWQGTLHQLDGAGPLKLDKRAVTTQVKHEESTQADWESGILAGLRADNGLQLNNGSALLFSKSSDRVTVPADPAIANIFDGGGMVEFVMRGGDNSGYVFNDGMIMAQYLTSRSLYIYALFSERHGLWVLLADIFDLGKTYRVIIFYNSDSVDNNPTVYVYDVQGNGGIVAVSKVLQPVGTRRDTPPIRFTSGTTQRFSLPRPYRRLPPLVSYRTAAQIKADAWKELNGDEDGLAGYWKFNEGRGQQ